MSIRLHIIVEGQTEETFTNRILVPHLAGYSVWGNARCVTTSRKHGVKHRGGFDRYELVKNDIVSWMKEDQNPDAFFTTMFDLYALPTDFPGYCQSQKQKDSYKRVAVLEEALSHDIHHPHFVPHIQLHEFETLLLVNPEKLDWVYLEHNKAIQNLVHMASGFASPELIDDGEETAPSKRIIKEIPEYEGMKVSAGPLVTEKIGLRMLRSKCQHFDKWICRLESLGSSG